MNNWLTEEVRELFQAVAKLNTEEECRLFFEDVCTVREIKDIAQRLRVAKLLEQKLSYTAINRQTGVSTATISRVSRCLDYGSGGYRLVLDRREEAGE